MGRRCLCNKDCFHCQYKDCICSDVSMDEFEKKCYKIGHASEYGQVIRVPRTDKGGKANERTEVGADGRKEDA